MVMYRGDLVEEALLKMRREFAGTPVIVGEPDDTARLMDVWDEDYDFGAELEAANALDLTQWRRSQSEENEGMETSPDQDKIYPEGTSPMTRLQIGLGFGKKPSPQVLIATIPTSEPWQVPLYLRFGNWNACPAPAIHAALARDWFERYGAVIATLSSDIVEFTVERPPASPEDALKLAHEQFLYCPDIVEQGVGSIATLAKALEKSNRWYFWWD